MIRTLSIVYASSTGHTEFVVDTLAAFLEKNADLRISRQRAETTKPEDLKKGDILLLACGSWNTGGPEGQMQPHMHDLLTGRAAGVDLSTMPAAAIGLGDDRYFYTARAADKLGDWLKTRNANLLLPPLKIINEPFDQKTKIELWAKELAAAIAKIPAKVS